MEEKDLSQYLKILPVLSDIENLTLEQAKQIFQDKIYNCPDHVIYVAEINDQILGAATLLIEQKFAYGGSLVGHIEDVVVDKKLHGKNIGKQVIKKLLDYAKDMNCRKTLLDCEISIIPFYQKNDFKVSSIGLRHDHRWL